MPVVAQATVVLLLKAAPAFYNDSHLLGGPVCSSWEREGFPVFEFEIEFAHKRANEARERATSTKDETARADWLTMARMWERLADEYEAFRNLRAG